MRYSIDLRQRVVSYVRSGGSQTEACEIFKVSRKTVYRWLCKGDDLHDAPRKRYAGKLDMAALAAHVRDKPEMLLRERAVHFGVTPHAIWYALKRQNITKKNDEVSGE